MFALGVGAHWLLGRGVYGGAAAAAGTSSDVLDLGKVSRLFAEHGFVVIRGLFTEDEIATLRGEAFPALIAASTAALAVGGGEWRRRNTGAWNLMIEHGGTRYDFELKDGVTKSEAERNPSAATLELLLAAHCGSAHPSLARLGGGDHPKLLALAAALLDLAPAPGQQMTQIIQQAHFKPPGSSCAFPWHQDSTFRRVHQGDFVDTNGRGSYCNISVAVDTEFLHGPGDHNGPLAVVPGLHRGGHIGGPLGLDPRTIDPAAARFPVLAPGDALCIGPFTVHGSKANASPTEWRRSFITGFAVPEAIQTRHGGTATHGGAHTAGMSWFCDRLVPHASVMCTGRVELV